MITGLKAEEDFFTALTTKEQTLLKGIHGAIWRDGTRPRDSKAEDVILRLTSLSSGQTQYGVITLLCHCPDIDHGKGNTIRNSARLAEIAELAQYTAENVWKSLPEYYITAKPYQGITSQISASMGQHFLNVPIYFEVLNTDY